MCEIVSRTPLDDDLRPATDSSAQQRKCREGELQRWITEDIDPGKRTALRHWRDSVLGRLQPRRDRKPRADWQIVRLPQMFLPYVQTAEGRVVFGPDNDVWTLTSYQHRSQYQRSEQVVPPQSSMSDSADDLIPHHSE